MESHIRRTCGKSKYLREFSHGSKEERWSKFTPDTFWLSLVAANSSDLNTRSFVSS